MNTKKKKQLLTKEGDKQQKEQTVITLDILNLYAMEFL